MLADMLFLDFDDEITYIVHEPIDYEWTWNSCALRRLWHLIKGHPRKESKLLQKVKLENHPDNDHTFVYTVNVHLCSCGLIFFDHGMEFRDKSFLNKN